MNVSLTDFSEEELTFMLRLNLAQREIVIDQKQHLEHIFHDAVDLHKNAAYKRYVKELDILERFITQLENALEIVLRNQTVTSN